LNSLKLFVFGQLDNAGYNVATISKLGSTGALIACIMFLKDWVTLVEDLIAFMKKSQINLRNGLIVLERLPE
jgi:tetrahydromethanopterin S-methyltransferase subunit E